MLAAIRRLGAAAGVDALACVGERAAITGQRPGGRISAGGTCRLLRAADGWMAVSLAREDDLDLLPAWLDGCRGNKSRNPRLIASANDWEAVAGAVEGRRAAEVVARGRLLGLPVAVLGERAPAGLYRSERLGDAPPLTRPPRVVDLSSLWAGPLCSRILLQHGATVVKVESATRPDGARRGTPAFFEALNAGKELVTVDFPSGELRHLLQSADVVVEGSRPRALEQLGIDAAAVVAGGPRLWLSITGHGRTGPQRDWVAFGDDAAVAGGLVEWHSGEPAFYGDAVADPLTGMAGAVAVTEALASGGRWLVDCNLAGVAAHVAAA